MEKRRVVVTGLGIVSPFGCGIDKFWNSLIAGKSGIKKITRIPLDGHLVTFGGEATTFEDEVIQNELLDAKEMKRMDRFTQFACVASDEAVKDANLDISKEDPYRVGVIVGSGAGGFDTYEKQHKAMIDRGPTKCSPFTIPMLISNMAAGRVSMRHGAKGINKAIVTACATGYLYLIDGLTGEILDTKRLLEGTIEASPIVYNDVVILGTRDDKIHALRIK